MALERALLIASVAHARLRPKRNAFHYHVYYLCTALREIASLGPLRLLSLNRFNLFSFHDKDHGDAKQKPDEWIAAILAQWNLLQADGDVVLLTMPRLLGYAFNPVSFWFCLDKQGGLRAVLSEVCNTFGEKHCYLTFHDDRRAIGPDDWLRAEKIFHVSPYLTVEGHYQFRFHYAPGRIGVWINHYDQEGLILTTSVAGKRRPLTSPALLACFFRYPLMTLKVVGLIHYQAFRLFLKGVRYIPKPPPPQTEISR